MRNVYLDYSATTPVKDEVLQEMIPYFTEKFGNPSSLYDKGLESKDAVTHAREQVAALIGEIPVRYTTLESKQMTHFEMRAIKSPLLWAQNRIVFSLPPVVQKQTTGLFSVQRTS